MTLTTTVGAATSTTAEILGFVVRPAGRRGALLAERRRARAAQEKNLVPVAAGAR